YAPRDAVTSARRPVVRVRLATGCRSLPEVVEVRILDLELEPPAGHDDLEAGPAAGRRLPDCRQDEGSLAGRADRRGGLGGCVDVHVDVRDVVAGRPVR